MKISSNDIRDVFFDEFYAVGSQDQNVVFLSDDMDAFSLQKFRRDFPDRYYNIGVAEQNLINVAAGLASCGKKVFVYGICSFVTLRCYEQIKVNICSMNLPVTIIGAGAGFSFGFDGPTHHGLQDTAAMRLLPEMTIYDLSDDSVAAASVQLAYQSPSPVYIRLDKGHLPVFDQPKDGFSSGFRVLKPLTETNIISCGAMTARAYSTAEKLSQNGIEVGVVDVYRLKPIDRTFVEQVLQPSKQLVTVEENSIVGGLGTIVAELLADYGLAREVKRIASADEQFLKYGSREWLQKVNQLDEDSLVEVVSSLSLKR